MKTPDDGYASEWEWNGNPLQITLERGPGRTVVARWGRDVFGEGKTPEEAVRSFFSEGALATAEAHAHRLQRQDAMFQLERLLRVFRRVPGRSAM
jgi:hypothetical protein